MTKFIAVFLFALPCVPPALADVTAFEYRLGGTTVSENQHRIVIHARTTVAISILPGGRNWPLLSLDEQGRIYAGNTIIDADTGKTVSYPQETLVLPHGVSMKVLDSGYRFRRAGRECTLSLRQFGLNRQKPPFEILQSSNLIFTSSSNSLMALATKFGSDGVVSNHFVERIDIEACRVTIEKIFGREDLFVELGHSAHGGWWLTGSIEQSLIHSSDGRRWRSIRLPAELSSLVSSYIVNEREMWLAAILPTKEGLSAHLLVYSDDGGKHWRNVVENDPLLNKVPVAWLEGQKRRVRQ